MSVPCAFEPVSRLIMVWSVVTLSWKINKYKMFGLATVKNSAGIVFVRAHLCTLAIALNFNSLWRIPKDAFRYGGIQYLFVHSAAMIVVALPVTLLHLAAGQLSQQDSVGIWSAVPFFKGVGYLRLLITFVGSIYTLIYVSWTATYFLYTLNYPMPVCMTLEENNMDYYESENNLCANGTVIATTPVLEVPEHYVAVGLISMALWIVFPFVLYSPVKCMKRIYYFLGPLVLTLIVVVAAVMSRREGLTSFHNAADWLNFVEPTIWHDALTQALWSSQIAGGFLVPVGGTVYSNTNVQWTALIFVIVNILTSWLGSLFWFAITNPTFKDPLETSLLVLAQKAANERGLPKEWPLVLFVTMLISGFISMIILLYPLYDHFRRIGGQRWRFISIGSSFVGIIITLVVLVLHSRTLYILDNIVSPFLISFCTMLEISAFVFIYGWKTFVGDVEFLCGSEINKFWILGWCATPGVVIPFMVWWMSNLIIENTDSTETATLIAIAVFAIVIFAIFALVATIRQEQYDCLSKLQASFKPSRHWGPRDPITHHCWLARREDDRCTSRRCFHRRTSSRQHALTISSGADSDSRIEKKQRTHSDDVVYTVYRRKHLKDHNPQIHEIKRPKSLDWGLPAKLNAHNLNVVTDDRPFHGRKLSLLRFDTNAPVHVKRVSLDPR